MIPPAYKHQRETVDFCLTNPQMLNFSDPGTGKTRAHADAYVATPNRGRALVLAPLSILEVAWAQDIAEYQPTMKVAIADAKHRKAAMQSDSDFVIANHAGIKAIVDMQRKDKGVLREFTHLIADEADAYKNLAGRGGSAQAKALADVRHLFKYRQMLTGSPGANSILDLWGIAFLCDDGKALGDSYFGFRNQVTVPHQVGPSAQMIEWRERPGALEMVMKLLEPITIRYRKEDCVDIPPNHVHTRFTKLPTAVRNIYNTMLYESLVELENGSLVSAIHAGARAQKLLQICTGAVYNNNGDTDVVHLDRYQLVTDLVLERPWPCVVVFNWRHEREQLVALAEAKGIKHAVIDGTVPHEARADIVRRFQAGEIRELILHPQTAAHGLTLTTGRTTIWSSPTPRADWFIQANARIDRNGQKFETETILIIAENTREARVYDMLQGKVERVSSLLGLIVDMKEAA